MFTAIWVCESRIINVFEFHSKVRKQQNKYNTNSGVCYGRIYKRVKWFLRQLLYLRGNFCFCNVICCWIFAQLYKIDVGCIHGIPVDKFPTKHCCFPQKTKVVYVCCVKALKKKFMKTDFSRLNETGWIIVPSRTS